MKVLVVDDNPLTATVVAGVLRSYNFDVIVAYRGLQGLEYLAENPQVQLIIVDIMMPEMDGFEFITKLREEPAWQDTPVIICTALADKQTVSRISALGCKHYVLKPVTEEELVQKVWKALETSSVILDHRDVVMERVGIDAATYDQTIRTFSQILDQKIKSLEDWILADVQNISLDIRELVEGAILIGARRLSAVLEDMTAIEGIDIPSPSRSEWALLLREIKALRRAMSPSSTLKFEI